MYGKVCYLPIELKHKAFWVVKQFNMNIDDAGVHRILEISELDELRNDAYDSS